jgi:hypothetical protein
MTNETMKSPTAALLDRIATMGRELRAPLVPLLEEIAGSPPRPTRLMSAIGLDKSLASRLVRAARAASDAELVHLIPSPTGLRIFSSRAKSVAAEELVADFEDAVDSFEELLGATPGGRDAIDSLISESSSDVRERREHRAKQATFKSMSYLLGHYCETLATALFLVPSKNGRTVDAIEVHQRIGLRRLRPSTPLPLLSIHTPPEDEPPDDSTWIEAVAGGLGTFAPQDFLLPKFSSEPLPDLEVNVRGPLTTFLLAGNPSVKEPTRLTSAFRIRNGWAAESTGIVQPIRGYVLHMPCRSVVRDVFVADDVFAVGMPRVAYRLPTPGGIPGDTEPDRRDQGAVDLSATIQQLPSDGLSYEVPGVPESRAAVERTLALAGHADTAFRGWRCTLAYPVPLIEMFWWLLLPVRR